MNTPASSIDGELERHELRTLELALSRVSNDIENYGTRLSQLSARITKLESIRQKWQLPSRTEYEEIMGFLSFCIEASLLSILLM
jgi:hypothetical protein